MNYRVNVFEKQKPYELVIILTEPNVRTRVMKGFERKIKSVVCPVSEKEIAEWKEQGVRVEKK